MLDQFFQVAMPKPIIASPGLPAATAAGAVDASADVAQVTASGRVVERAVRGPSRVAALELRALRLELEGAVEREVPSVAGALVEAPAREAQEGRPGGAADAEGVRELDVRGRLRCGVDRDPERVVGAGGRREDDPAGFVGEELAREVQVELLDRRIGDLARASNGRCVSRTLTVALLWGLTVIVERLSW